MKKYGLIGNNIGYSLSPAIHGRIFEYFGLADCQYKILDMGWDELQKSFYELANSYLGFNVTIPYKNQISRFAKINLSPISAINTIVSNNGEFVGYNTDIDGLRHSLAKNLEKLGYFDGFDHNRTNSQTAREVGQKNCVEKADYYATFDKDTNMTKPVETLIIGGGGGAEAAIYTMKRFGVSPKVKCRNLDRQKELADAFGTSFDYMSICPRLIINASGQPADSSDILLDVDTSKLEMYFDLGYNSCGLDKYFASRRVIYVDGKEMLIYQAIYAAKILYDAKIEGHIESLFDYIKKGLNRG